jgi:hypothetical protein
VIITEGIKLHRELVDAVEPEAKGRDEQKAED